MTGLPSFLTRSGRVRTPISRASVICGSFGLISRPAPWAWALTHDRPSDILLWITRGQGRVLIDGVRRGVSAHTAVFVPSGTLLSIDLPGTTTALYIESPDGLAETLPSAPLFLRVRDSLAQVELTGSIDAMSRELGQNRPMLADAIDAHLRLLAVVLKRQVAAGADDPGPEGAARRLTRRFAQMIQGEFRSSQSMGDYARRLDVTPTHLTRTCKAVSGMTAADLLTERKLHAARAALASPKPSIQQIARDLGFATPAYFTRFMRNQTGQAPSTLRQNARGLTLRL